METKNTGIERRLWYLYDPVYAELRCRSVCTIEQYIQLIMLNQLNKRPIVVEHEHLRFGWSSAVEAVRYIHDSELRHTCEPSRGTCICPECSTAFFPSPCPSVASTETKCGSTCRGCCLSIGGYPWQLEEHLAATAAGQAALQIPLLPLTSPPHHTTTTTHRAKQDREDPPHIHPARPVRTTSRSRHNQSRLSTSLPSPPL